MSINTIGYLYVATGDKYLEEASISAKSLKSLNENADITLITDKEYNNLLFNNVIIHPTDVKNYKEGLLYKVKHIYNSSPYERTLFIDTDTYFCSDCQTLFELLDFFDVAIAPDPTDPNKAYSQITKSHVGACLPYNTGVILFRKNSNNDFLFRKWTSIYEAKVRDRTVNREGDQTSFMEAWLESNSKIYILTHDWNARTPFFFTLNQPVKIIHGRHNNHEIIKEKLNKPQPYKHRCWIPIEDKCKIKKQGLYYRFKTTAKQLKDKFLLSRNQ